MDYDIARAYSKLMQKIQESPTGCVLYTGAKTGGGYGQVKVFDRTAQKYRTRGAHVVVYEHTHGYVPAGLDVHHECRTINCVNINHLKACTRKENVALCVRTRKRATHCTLCNAELPVKRSWNDARCWPCHKERYKGYWKTYHATVRKCKIPHAPSRTVTNGSATMS